MKLTKKMKQDAKRMAKQAKDRIDARETYRMQLPDGTITRFTGADLIRTAEALGEMVAAEESGDDDRMRAALAKMVSAVDEDIEKKPDSEAIEIISPICSSTIVRHPSDTVCTMRLLINWRSRQLRAGLVIGQLLGGKPQLTGIGHLCVAQWASAQPPITTIVFAEFYDVADEGIAALKAVLTDRLNRFANLEDNDALLLLAARDSDLYDDIGALLGIQNYEEDQP